ncbi:MAG: PorT family protein [Sinomicrobium sp.]|nr:PorT family protein [Sinomicrobium sp.]
MLRSLTFIVLLCLAPSLYGQSKKLPKRPKSPFNAGIIAGMNSSQLDGDYQSGYDKHGFSGGMQSTVFLNPALDLSIDLLFSQRGSKADSGSGGQNRVVNIHLNYAETNFLLNFLASRYEDGLPKFHIQAGLSYARLLSHRVKTFPYNNRVLIATLSERSSFTEIADHFNSDDFGVVGGAALHIGSHFTLSLRQNFSLKLLFNQEDIPERNNRSIRSFFIAIHGTYLFLNPYGKKKK